MTAPLTDYGEAGVCARVAIALIKRELARCPKKDVHPHILIGMTVERLRGLHLATVRLALLSLNVAVEEKRQSATWLKDVLYADLIGLPIRRCFYAEYKANRRRRPPC